MGKIYIIPEIKNIEESINLIKDFDGAFEYNDFWHPEILQDVRKQEQIIEAYAKYRTDFSNDTMHGAFLDISIHSVDPDIQEISKRRVTQSMDIAKRMGLRGVVFHTGLLAGCRLKSYLEHWEDENYRFYSELAQNYPNQTIFMENMFDETPIELARLSKKMQEVENFGICFDYAHGALTNCPTEKWLSELSENICHMHINDNDLCSDLHNEIGNGKIDWLEFGRLLEKYNVDSTVLIEVNGYEKQKKSLEYLKNNKIISIKK